MAILAGSKGDAWAPEMHYVQGTGLYHVYFTMRQKFGKPAIGVATAPDPFGPFTDLGAPLSTRGSCQGVLDSTYFKDPISGRYFLAWRYNGLCYAKIEIQEMEPDGLTFKQGSEPHTLLVSQPGDEFSIEAPWFVYR